MLFRLAVFSLAFLGPSFSVAVSIAGGLPSEPSSPEKELEKLARELREKESPGLYNRLSAWARRRSAGELGLRAALALGYFDYTKERYPQALSWLEKAEGDPVVREYAAYWSAEAYRAQGRNQEALTRFERFRQEFPESVMSEPALESLAHAALAATQPERALAALKSYPKTRLRSKLLFLQAQAEEQAGQLEAAATDYQTMYDQFPLSDEAGEAGSKVRLLQRSLGEKFAAAPVPELVARAEMLYGARRWNEALSAYQELLPRLAGSGQEQGQLRVAECRVQLGAPPDVLAQLALSDPVLDAERLDSLVEAYRSQKNEASMRAAIEQTVGRDPTGAWAEAALYSGGNYFWVNQDRQHAVEFYRHVLEKFPNGRYVANAQWRVAWAAYLDGGSEAQALLEEHLRRFPGSPFTVDALYWLGRAAERAGDLPMARGFYRKAEERFPQTYFGHLASGRLGAIGPVPANGTDVLDLVPGLPAPSVFSEEVPPAASERWDRAQALRSIAFDASAELELRAAYAATAAPSLLLDAARAAVDAEHYPATVATVRQLFPQLEARSFEEVPEDVWQLAYPLPFESEIRQAAQKARVDPLLVAGLIRQESQFQLDAVSRAGAIGLMQLLPKTAVKMARHLHVRYRRERLFDPRYNLRLGTVYLAGLIHDFGGLEAGLAAYNAGEDRVTAWQASRNFAEPAEFVESIPFTETREYVQIVIRNAEIYRHFYGRAK